MLIKPDAFKNLNVRPCSQKRVPVGKRKWDKKRRDREGRKERCSKKGKGGARGVRRLK
jgi:hypothetical protein